jgi:anti-sigma B factor antagonist
MAPHEIDHVLPGPALSVGGQDGYTVVTISGEIDIASAPVLREQLLGLLRPGASRLVVDLSRVTFCDASGLAVLVGASRRADQLDGVLRLAAPAPLMTKVLRLTGLDSRFEIFATVPEAIGAPDRRGIRDAGVPKPRACWSAQQATGELHGTAAGAATSDDDDLATSRRLPGPAVSRARRRPSAS